MAAMFRRYPLYQQEAIRLGNPKTPKFYNAEPPRIYGHHGIITVGGSFTHGGRDQGETIFQYQHDLTKFDSGKVIIVRYKENMDPADHWALENKFLRSESFMPEYVFNQVLLPVLLPLKADVTCLTFSTVHGRPYFDLQETYSLYDQPFNIIPSNLDIPRIRISDLVAPETFSSSNVNMNVVQYKGDLYTFMHHGTCPPEGTTTHDDTLLREVIALSKISNPLVLQPSYIVTDDKPTDGIHKNRFRGYLLPFLPAGSLEDVITSLKRDAEQNHLQLPEVESQSSITRPRMKTKRLLISWPVKHHWCVDMARGILALHQAKLYTGCLTLGRFMVDKSGQIKLVDISPDTMGFVMPYAAPEVVNEDGLNLELTAARDIYSLGLIFWALAEEIVIFDRVWPSDIPVLSWTESPDSSPMWFRQLVQSCLRIDPNDRPSATAILTILVTRLSTVTYK